MKRIEKIAPEKRTNRFTFEHIREHGLLLYEYIRGSHCHGINTETSDVDTGGVYILPNEYLLNLGYDYVDTIQDERHDTTWYELNKFMELLTVSNPTVLEALFIDDEFVIYEHPLFTELKKNRDIFITKQCFAPFGGYAVAQIKKARGLNKKIVQPVEHRKDILDFCYTTYRQGSSCMKEWLEKRGLHQKYCGVVNINNMRDAYGVYYDWGMHESENEITLEYANFKNELGVGVVAPQGYKGIMNEEGTSNQLRFSSVLAGQEPICTMMYNADGYGTHCKKYREYQEWVAKRNPVRYESNLDKNYDSKNMCECMRLMNMCCEIAKDGTVSVNRDGIDREFLLSIKRHEYEYDDLIKLVDEKKAEMDELIERSTITERIDVDYINEYIIKVRNEFFK